MSESVKFDHLNLRRASRLALLVSIAFGALVMIGRCRSTENDAAIASSEIEDAMKRAETVYIEAVRSSTRAFAAECDAEVRRFCGDERVGIDARVQLAIEARVQQVRFEQGGAEPTSPVLGSAVARHLKRLGAARTACSDAFEQLAESQLVTNRDAVRSILDGKRRVLDRPAPVDVAETEEDGCDVTKLATIVFSADDVPDPLPACLAGLSELTLSIASELQRARAERLAALEPARVSVLDEFDATERRIVANKRLSVEDRYAKTEDVRRERHEFVTSGILHETRSVSTAAARNYEKQVAGANLRLRAAFDSAALRCLPDSVDLARAVLNARSELIGAATSSVEQRTPRQSGRVALWSREAIDLLGKELLTNGGCETPSDDGGILGWDSETWLPGVPGPEGTKWTQWCPTPIGTFYFWPNSAQPVSECSQDVDVRPVAREIDAGRVVMRFNGRTASLNQGRNGDQTEIQIDFLRGDGTEAVETLNSGAEYSPQEWRYVEWSEVVPAGTRVIRVTLRSIRQSGRNNDGFFDDLSLTVARR